MTDAAEPPADSATPRWLSRLSSLHGLLGRMLAGRAILRALNLKRFARERLYDEIIAKTLSRPDDITVVIGIRDRIDQRIDLALRSIREQRYPSELIRILVVDYGSKPPAAELTAELCRAYQAEYRHIDETGVWSRSRCLNVGVRRAETKYVLTSDTDILLSPNYLSEAVECLREHPLSVICAPMLDLPEESSEQLGHTAANHSPLLLDLWRGWSTTRNGWPSHPSVTVTYAAFHHLIRGYDEAYELWGSEDIDLLSRLLKLGLDHRIFDSADAFYLHQWHPKFENLPEDDRDSVIRKNFRRRHRTHTILRNDMNWGRPAREAVRPAAHAVG